MKIALTGHTNIEKANDSKLLENGNVYDEEIFIKVYNEIRDELLNICEDKDIDYNDLTLISGMARGADEVLAEIAVDDGLNLILSIPHTIHWHKNRGLRKSSSSTPLVRAQAINYNKFLEYEKSTIFEIKKTYGEGGHKYANFARNQHMVDKADLLISYKRYNSTGTNHCIKEGLKQDKYVGNVGSIRIGFENKDACFL